MRNNTVWDAMSKAFENSKGDLAEWMDGRSEAAEGEGRHSWQTISGNDCCQRQTDRHVLAG